MGGRRAAGGDDPEHPIGVQAGGVGGLSLSAITIAGGSSGARPGSHSGVSPSGGPPVPVPPRPAPAACDESLQATAPTLDINHVGGALGQQRVGQRPVDGRDVLGRVVPGGLGRLPTVDRGPGRAPAARRRRAAPGARQRSRPRRPRRGPAITPRSCSIAVRAAAIAAVEQRAFPQRRRRQPARAAAQRRGPEQRSTGPGPIAIPAEAATPLSTSPAAGASAGLCSISHYRCEKSRPPPATRGSPAAARSHTVAEPVVGQRLQRRDGLVGPPPDALTTSVSPSEPRATRAS